MLVDSLPVTCIHTYGLFLLRRTVYCIHVSVQAFSWSHLKSSLLLTLAWNAGVNTEQCTLQYQDIFDSTKQWFWWQVWQMMSMGRLNVSIHGVKFSVNSIAW